MRMRDRIGLAGAGLFALAALAVPATAPHGQSGGAAPPPAVSPSAIDPETSSLDWPDEVEEPPPPALLPNGLPEELGRQTLEEGMARAKPFVAQCQRLESYVGIVTVRLTITRRGAVQSVAIVSPLGKTTTAECVARAVRRLSFPPFRGAKIPTMELTFPFLLRAGS